MHIHEYPSSGSLFVIEEETQKNAYRFGIYFLFFPGKISIRVSIFKGPNISFHHYIDSAAGNLRKVT